MKCRMVETGRFQIAGDSGISAFLAIGISRPVANKLGDLEDQAGRTSVLDRFAMVTYIILQIKEIIIMQEIRS